MLNRDVEELVRLIRSGRLSASEEAAALSNLHRNLPESETDSDSGVLYATPYWNVEPAPASRLSAGPQVAVVLDLASGEAGGPSLADALLSGLRIPERIDLREDDRYFADLASSDDPDAKLSERESLTAISLRSLQSVLLLIVDNLQATRQSVKDPGDLDEAGRVFLGRLLHVFGVVKALLHSNPSVEIRCVTLSDHRRVLSVGAAVSGLLKTLVLEHSGFSGRTIWACDLMAHDRSAVRFLWEELCGMEAGSHLEARFRDGARSVRRFCETAIADTGPTAQTTLRSGDVVLLTGGLGGVGRILAEHFVNERGARLVLAGRTARSMLPDEQAAFLQRYASDMEYVQADIAVPELVRSVVQAAERRFGRIDGVIHAAGVTKDGWLSGKGLSSVRDVLRPKVLGAYYLGESVRANLKFFVNFSSLASYRGNVGQSEYACANAFLDHHITVRNELTNEESPRCANLAINWPLWKAGGMRPSRTVTEQMERAFGLRALSSRQGVRCFEAALASGYGQVLVGVGDTARLRTHFLAQNEGVAETWVEQLSPNTRREDGDAPPSVVTVEPAGAKLPTAPLTDRARTALLERLTALVAETLAMQPGEVEPDASLSEYGFDSISLTELAAKISRAYEWIQLDATVFLLQPTLRELCEHLLTKHSSKFNAALGGPPIDGPLPSEHRHSENRLCAVPGTEGAASAGDIAIIGLGGRFPGARDAIELWKT